MTFLRVAAATLISAILASQAFAQDITLTSQDGKVEITGNLLSFDGEFYRVETQFGELTVDGSGVTCEGPACPSLTDFVAEVRFSGSSVMAEKVLPALIVGFAQQEGLSATPQPLGAGAFAYDLHKTGRDAPLGRFYFSPGNTGGGFTDLVADRADIVMALREIRPSEQEAAQTAGLGDLAKARRSRVIALDALVPIVARDNPVRQISPADLVRVLSGEIDNWFDLGGPDAPVSLHLPDAGSGLAQGVEDRLLAPAQATLAQDVVRYSRSSDLVHAVSDDPFAIGIASHAEVGAARALPLSGGCGHALVATRQSIKTEDYPLTSPMFLYLPEIRLPRIARQFLAYTQSAEAQMAIRKAGFVDQEPETMRIGLQGDRLANAVVSGGPEVGLEELQRMINTLRPKSRLSLSFRFEAGSSRPDAQSRSNIRQLAQALESGAIDARKLTFVGFSDGDGAASANARIAMLRARTVRNAVIAAVETAIPDSIEIAVDAFGEAMPMACDDTEWGRKVNRRVEVWVQ
ncbi:phosphate ABC transporter substrate-binding/OmpA family protein [Ruegeria sp. R14_0]|uniref:phosphate ABC transporter substrate-binding/OmpA family protein n=1 Tax=Ruegeria sp. R14_0 TaxID=2821100 RepID=UPI001ADCDE56|nr:phosphate ABC transporter substrate-binding/OmpA family protein [Ruegeria sp. R14_0]MBO9446010.1 substrate-binding domain-containing protein [Ruegeria sp. R14_0]